MILKSSLSICKKNWKPLSLLSVYTQLLYFPGTFGIFFILMLKDWNSKITVYNAILLLSAALILGVYVFIITALQNIALIMFINSGEDKLHFRVILARSLTMLKDFWWLGFLNTIIIISGFVLLFIPGVIYFVRYYFSTYILILDHIKGGRALQASRELVKGRFWAILRRVIFAFFLYFLFYFILSFIPKALYLPDPSRSAYWLMFGEPSKKITVNIVNNFINFIFSIFTGAVLTPVITTYHILLYKNAKQLYGKPLTEIPEKSNIKIFLPAILVFIFFIGLIGMIIYRAIRFFWIW